MKSRHFKFKCHKYKNKILITKTEATFINNSQISMVRNTHFGLDKSTDVLDGSESVVGRETLP